MAPRKRKNNDEENAVHPNPNPNPNPTTRVTRSTHKTKPIDENKLDSVSESESKTESEPTNNKKVKKTEADDAPKPKSKTIIIEHCKQCNQFKIRAIKVKNGLESGVAGINVLINPEKPRRGCFEVREEGGEKFISLLDMKRPFTPMKKLDMDTVISDIISKIK